MTTRRVLPDGAVVLEAPDLRFVVHHQYRQHDSVPERLFEHGLAA